MSFETYLLIFFCVTFILGFIVALYLEHRFIRDLKTLGKIIKKKLSEKKEGLKI